MKYFIICTTLCIAYQFSIVLSTVKARTTFLAAGEECTKIITLTEDEIDKFKIHELLSSHNGKCYEACVMKILGVITTDNKANKEGFVVGITIISPDDEVVTRLAEEVYTECAEVTDDDECEAAHKIASCLKEGKRNRGLDKAIKE